MKSSKGAFLTLLAGCVVLSLAAMAPPASSRITGEPPVPLSQDPTRADTTMIAPDTVSIAAPSATTTPPPTAITTTASAPPEDAGMFSKGKRRVSVAAGWGHSLGSDYLLIGVGVGYFLANGLQVGLDFEGWFLGDPTMYKVSPRADYVFWRMARIKPYAGAFYRWNFIGGGFEDLNSLGGRAGAFYKGYRGGMAGGGVVYERYLNCDDAFGSCDVLYPEFFVAVSF